MHAAGLGGMILNPGSQPSSRFLTKTDHQLQHRRFPHDLTTRPKVLDFFDYTPRPKAQKAAQAWPGVMVAVNAIPRNCTQDVCNRARYRRIHILTENCVEVEDCFQVVYTESFR